MCNECMLKMSVGEAAIKVIQDEVREQIAKEIEAKHKSYIEADFNNECDLGRCDHIEAAAIARGKH